MKHAPFSDATPQRLPRSLAGDATHERSRLSTPPSIPRWVKVLVIVALILFALFALARFTIVPYLHHQSGHGDVRAPAPLTSMLVVGGHQA